MRCLAGLLLALGRWLQHIVQRIKLQTGLYQEQGPNHVLLNAYTGGKGIQDHQDGPIYHSAACILSTGGSAVINFKQKLPQGAASFLAVSQALLWLKLQEQDAQDQSQ